MVNKRSGTKAIQFLKDRPMWLRVQTNSAGCRPESPEFGPSPANLSANLADFDQFGPRCRPQLAILRPKSGPKSVGALPTGHGPVRTMPCHCWPGPASSGCALQTKAARVEAAMLARKRCLGGDRSLTGWAVGRVRRLESSEAWTFRPGAWTILPECLWVRVSGTLRTEGVVERRAS